MTVAAITVAVRVGAGNSFTCALHATGRVSYCGLGGQGELGNGAFEDSTDPSPSPA